MSNSIFRDDVKEDHVNEDDCDHNSDQEQVELRKDDEKFVDKKDEEFVTVAGDEDDFLEKKEQQLGDGVSSTEDDENDGFRTPTSLEHRIPVPTQCPPAPKKSCKRKFEGSSSITEIIRSATKAIHERFMVFKKPRQDDDALS